LKHYRYVNIREKVAQYVLEKIEKIQGKPGTYWVSLLSLEFGLSHSKISEILEDMRQAGHIVVYGGRLYPRGFIPGKTEKEKEEEAKLEVALLTQLRGIQEKENKTSPSESETMKAEIAQQFLKQDFDVKPRDPIISVQTSTQDLVTPKQEAKIQVDESNSLYLLVYDTCSGLNVKERVAIYRKLSKECNRLLEEGVHVKHVQKSVLEVQGRENAYKLASILPKDKTKIKIYRVLEEYT